VRGKPLSRLEVAREVLPGRVDFAAALAPFKGVLFGGLFLVV